MKIKIRPDEAGTTGTSEWAAMNDWLAELREDGQAEPEIESFTGTAGEHYSGTASEDFTGTASGGESRAMAPAPAPRHAYVSRRGAGTRAATSTPAEAVTVRAIIGDELRTPTAWCEMGSCITWHADRSALGEADIRARAIGSGWRIDALGRLACPQCLQTSASFRATRPVVPWDRATAITMAARATVRGTRPARPAAGASGRAPRRPAHGHC